MRFSKFIAIVLGCFVAVSVADEPQRREVKLNGHNFTLPAGFDIELVAGPDLAPRPITADFDELGRLYVADSSGSNEPVQKQLEAKPHRIVRLEDTDGNGKFDKQIVFADRMMFPEGTMWLDGSLYVSAPPSIWKLTDTNDDGVADERVEWFQGKTLTGCANDLHGPYRGPDGWIYWCKGAFAEQTYEIRGKPWKTKASHIFRCKPDGSGLEPVMTGGMDNPVDVVFTPGGERIFSATFLHHPAGGKRDGLAHAIYGGVFGKDHAPIHDHPRTSPQLMPTLAELGPAAPCGLAAMESETFGKGYIGNLFTAQFNLRKVSRHILTPKGATYQSQDEDFLVSDHVDFHPTDVLEDADGSLLVVDTGGWYKLCCPTAQFPRPEVLGGIYRIRRTDAEKIRDPRGREVDWKTQSIDALTTRLNDSRPAVRKRALDELARRDEKDLTAHFQSLSANKPELPPRTELNLVWLATRRNTAAAAEWRRTRLNAKNDDVRRAAMHAAALLRDRNAQSELIGLLNSSEAFDRRGAAEALGRIGNANVVRKLFAALEATADEMETHSLIYALIEINNPLETQSGLRYLDLKVARGALIALDQMGEGKLPADEVERLLSSHNPALQAAAWWIAERHPEWSETLENVYREELFPADLPEAPREPWAGRLARGAKQELIQKLLAEAAVSPEADRTTAWAAMAKAGLKETPASWLVAVETTLTGYTPFGGQALRAYRTFPEAKKPSPEILTQLRRIAHNPASEIEMRLAAAAAFPSGEEEPNDSLWNCVLESLRAEQPATIRAGAAEALARLKLGKSRLLALALKLKDFGPTERDRALDAFTQTTDQGVGTSLVSSLNAIEHLGLRADQIRSRLAKYNVLVQLEVDHLCLKLDKELEKKRAKLHELSQSLAGGDVRRGQALFQRQKSACFACHAVGYVGGKIGPDLTKIGSIRTEQDLLESIVFPSASIARSYETTQFLTTADKVVQGLIREETPEDIVVVTGANQETRLRRDEISDSRPANVSIMPAGLETQFTPAELADLIAYLKACR